MRVHKSVLAGILLLLGVVLAGCKSQPFMQANDRAAGMTFSDTDQGFQRIQNQETKTNDRIETIEKSEIPEKLEFPETTGIPEQMRASSNYHQIFYGEWQISGFIPGGRFSNPVDAKAYIGSCISFFAKEVQVEGLSVLSDPIYSCVLVAAEDSHYFWKYFFPDDPNDIISPESTYFAYIVISNLLDIGDHGGNEILKYMNGFYIKDAETLIFNGSFGLLEMKRIAYVEGYKDMIEGV